MQGRRDRCRGREGQNSNSTASCERDGDGRSAGSSMAATCAWGLRRRARARRVDTVGQGWSRALRQFRESLVPAGRTWRTATLLSLFLITLLCGCDKSARGSARQGTRGHQGAVAVAYVLTGALLDAYDAVTGKRLWRFTSSQPASLPSMTVVGDVVYLSDGDLYALRARDGHQIWRAPIGGGAFVSPLSVVGGIAYVESSGVVYAVNTRD